MNQAVYFMEMRRNLKSFFIWSGSICSILFFGMLFYPAITADGLLDQMDALFENPMMKGVMGAFGADVADMGNLTGFYVTYNSMYNVLLACIFAAVIAGRLLAGEESDKTADFLFTKPLSRRSIFASKALVLLSYLTLLCLLYFGTSLAAMESVKKGAPLELVLSQVNKSRIIRGIEEHPRAIYEAFDLTEEKFDLYSLSYASLLMRESTGELAEMDLEIEDLNRLIQRAQEGPEGLFEEVLNQPEETMELFSVPEEERKEFLENIRKEREEYRGMKEAFFQSPDIFLKFFEADPAMILKPYGRQEGSMEQMVKLLELPEDLEQRIFKPYSVKTLAVLTLYVYLLVLSMGSLILFLSLLMKRGKSVLGASLGLLFFFYFLHSLAGMAGALSPAAAALGYLSPFSWMNTDYSLPGFGLEWWRIGLFFFLTGVSLVLALRRFRTKDILL